MKKWYLKAIVQKIISFLPFRNQINFFFQKYVTKGVELHEEHFFNKYGHLLDHLEHFTKATGKDKLDGITCLELGTGWYPIIPIGYFLKGAGKIYSVDISAHLTTATLLRCLEEIDRHQKRFLAGLGTIDSERWQLLQNIRQQATLATPLSTLCEQLNFIPIVKDVRELALPEENILLLSSNNTYEHIYPQVLGGIVAKLWSLTAPGGVMSHFIDMSDHFAHMDKSITIYNFLRFSEQQWQWIDNPIQPQNRWRLARYRELYEELNIPYSEEKIRAGNLHEVQQLALAPPYSTMQVEEVAISHAYLVSQRPA
ncbi:class I SAM-dependent methyltransferase [Lewinella sp. LCG006]|uniref:class I SAM-dependent methyltransferase n=1 Tax=Lewinella sp. LCG006 TaxID=3231911 RepID=UPI00345FB22E